MSFEPIAVVRVITVSIAAVPSLIAYCWAKRFEVIEQYPMLRYVAAILMLAIVWGVLPIENYLTRQIGKIHGRDTFLSAIFIAQYACALVIFFAVALRRQRKK